jgi:hypothetical protein
MAALLKAAKRPSAVICSNDWTAIGAMHALDAAVDDGDEHALALGDRPSGWGVHHVQHPHLLIAHRIGLGRDHRERAQPGRGENGPPEPGGRPHPAAAAGRPPACPAGGPDS